jgi:hypothetical protein
MKRILLSFVAVAALTFGGMFTSTAQAHGPYCGYRSGGYGYGGYGYGSRGYGAYNGHLPRAAYVPYGAGYSGGWQPYQGYYYQQPRFGLYLGF